MEESPSMGIQRAIASINNEDQNTQKEADIPGGNENKNDELVIEIRKIFESSSTWDFIQKVPHHLRKWREEAYTPQVISIGPFHHKNERLKVMEKYKERYFRDFVNRSRIKLDNLVSIIKEMEERIRWCYEEAIDLSSDRFVKMILVDASFILELFIREKSESQTSNDHMFGKPRAKAIMLDLLLLENQLPFFVIEKLLHFASPSLSDSVLKYDDLVGLSLNYFMHPSFQFRRDSRDHPNVKIKHFTDLLRTFQIPPPEKRPKRDYQQKGLLYTATHLHEAGVQFEVVTSECFSNIKFEKGVLKIPRLELDDWTEAVFRNFMALEQTNYIEDSYFTSYLLLMNSLINARKDVDLLCKKKILVNNLGDNSAANSMMNNLNKGIIFITERDDYIDLCDQLNRFYEKQPRHWHRRMAHTTHRWMAVFKREFFSTPSQAASTIVTLGVITVLTLIQTVCSIMQVRDSSRKAV